MSTAGYNAGIDSSDVTVSFITEATWNVVPNTPTFQYVRLTGEGLSETKSRARPGEIRATGDAAHAITQQVEAGGSLNFAFSYGTYDTFLEGMINSAVFPADLAITSVATTGIITAYDGDTTPLPTAGGTAAGFATNSTSLLDSITAGQWIRVSGYGNATDGLYRVLAVDTANDEIQVSKTEGAGSVMVDASASTGTEVHIQGSMIRNGTTVCSYQIEKQLAAALFLNYGGAYITSANISAQVGNFMEGSFDFFAAQEAKGTTTLSTGGTPTAAPTGNVIDTVAGFSKLEVGGAAIAAVAQGIDLSITKEGARGQYGLGNAAAQGMARGTLTVSGTLSVYFTDFTLYDLYKNETDSLVSFAAVDQSGDGYIFTLPAATLMNPSIVAGGPDTDVVSEFELEGNPAPASDTVYSGVTIQIDKIPAAI
jgi:hypothetical protein